MEGFTYNNIFETKGIEYIIIIAFLILIIPFWIMINRRSAVTALRALGSLTASVLRLPPGIFFSRNHTWAYLEKSGTARVGIDDLLLHLTGEVQVHPAVSQGTSLKRGDLIAEISAGGKRLRVLSPISGEVTGINNAVAENSAILSEDPYGKGWIMSIKPSSWLSEISMCYLAEDAVAWSRQELARFRDFLAGVAVKYSPEAVPVMLQDGGELCDKPLSGMPSEVWQEFEKDFMALAK